MPAHKNQHFVPRVHLAPFSVGAAGAAINLLNIGSGRLIPNAPLRNQCARNYLYSPAGDMRLEKMLQDIEGQYAEALRYLADPNRPAAGAAIENLRLFAWIQHLRTDQAMRQRKEAEEKVYDLSFEGAMSERAPPPQRQTDRDFMLSTMRAGLLNMKFTADLKHCVLDNETAVDFVTSDDPAIMTNRFLKQRFGHTNFGMASSGLMLMLPLSPRQLLLMYDGNVYTLPDKEKGRLRLRRESSVRAMNDLQFIRAAHNIYFANWKKRDEVAADLSLVSPLRRQSWINVQVLVPGDRSDGRERYRRPHSLEERLSATEKIVQMSSEYPASTRWASEIKIRQSVRTYQNGSAMGMVRNPEWLTAEGRGESPRPRRSNPIYLSE